MNVWTLLPVVLTSLAAGCTLACTQAGCIPGLRIEMQADEPLPVGDYVLEVTGDTESLDCSFVITDTDCGQHDSCLREGCEELMTVANEEGVYEMTLHLYDTYDETIDIVLTGDDGTVWLDTTETVTYETFYPNGEQCGGACDGAYLELEIDG